MTNVELGTTAGPEAGAEEVAPEFDAVADPEAAAEPEAEPEAEPPPVPLLDAAVDPWLDDGALLPLVLLVAEPAGEQAATTRTRAVAAATAIPRILLDTGQTSGLGAGTR
jgi:hypothetical protein